MEKPQVEKKIEEKVREFSYFLEKIFGSYYVQSTIPVKPRKEETGESGLIKTGRTINSIRYTKNRITIDFAAGFIEYGNSRGQPARYVVRESLNAYFGDKK